MTADQPADYERLRRAVEDALIVLDGYSGRVVDAAKVVLREALNDENRGEHVVYRCRKCGKLAYPYAINPHDDNPPKDDCPCYTGPRWMRGIWVPDRPIIREVAEMISEAEQPW